MKTSMHASGQTTIIRRKRRRRKRTPLFPFLLLAILGSGLVAGGVWLAKNRPIASVAAAPDGYLADARAFRQEYEELYGNAAEAERLEAGFRSAAEMARKRNVPGAASVLESLAKTAAVPIVFHNLGVVYSALNDYARAAEAFREGLAHNQEYAPIRKLLREARGIPPGSADPYTREQEPNDDAARANVIALRAPVTGEIAGARDTADFYRVIAPAVPRDLIAIEVASQKSNFEARLRVYNEVQRIEPWGDKEQRAGGVVKVIGGPPPNSSIYVAVASANGESGSYLLTVTPLKAYDRFEPNDEITAAKRISIGEEVSANIMDEADSDFFVFTSPRKGVVTVEVRGLSPLIPMMAVYNSDHRNIGFIQDGQRTGGVLRHKVEAEKDHVLYVQISAQSGTSGAYVLRVD